MPEDDARILMLFMMIGYMGLMACFNKFLKASKKMRLTWTFATCFAYGVIRILHGIIESILSQQRIIGNQNVFENSQDYYEVVNDEVYIRNYITQKEYVILLGILATIWILSISSFIIVYKQWKDLPRNTNTESESLLHKMKKAKERKEFDEIR
uniref:Uncharacterized protein n=1 Tax=Acrobeloides nanus TaxID=290746 RepID=A0A914E8W9_9BILA